MNHSPDESMIWFVRVGKKITLHTPVGVSVRNLPVLDICVRNEWRCILDLRTPIWGMNTWSVVMLAVI
jgi:hypothetical protein